MRWPAKGSASGRRLLQKALSLLGLSLRAHERAQLLSRSCLGILRARRRTMPLFVLGRASRFGLPGQSESGVLERGRSDFGLMVSRLPLQKFFYPVHMATSYCTE